jgi:hypothetical protein
MLFYILLKVVKRQYHTGKQKLVCSSICNAQNSKTSKKTSYKFSAKLLYRKETKYGTLVGQVAPEMPIEQDKINGFSQE